MSAPPAQPCPERACLAHPRSVTAAAGAAATPLPRPIQVPGGQARRTTAERVRQAFVAVLPDVCGRVFRLPVALLQPRRAARLLRAVLVARCHRIRRRTGMPCLRAHERAWRCACASFGRRGRRPLGSVTPLRWRPQGDTVQNPLLYIPGVADYVNLRPFFEEAHNRIREVDGRHMVRPRGSLPRHVPPAWSSRPRSCLARQGGADPDL